MRLRLPIPLGVWEARKAAVCYRHLAVLNRKK